jgi:predicted ATPase/class 3 adenylate cyclase
MMSTLPTGTVTFLFTDIEGSTRLWQQHPQAMSAAHARHDQILRGAIESNHGHVFQVVGDSFSAAFNTAPEAVQAVLAAQRALSAEKWGEAAIRVRMGLHTGAAELDESATRYHEGYATIASAQRVMSAAHGGQILLSQATRDLLQDSLPPGVGLRDLGEQRLKDLRSPLHLYQITTPDLRNDFPAIKSLSVLPNNLPVQLTSFIGRERELAEARKLLSTSRLLTLIGPGGTGKTRLALQVAAEVSSDFADGVWLAELAPLADPAFVVSSLASVFDLREVLGVPLLELVTDYLRARELLLILDNCEHLVEASARIADGLLRACPRLKILASSREALGVAGETVFRVPSLSLPQQDSLEALLRCEAAQLFIQRASKAQSEFNLTEHNAGAVAQICRRLDGIPLAIELAAARISLFTPEQIAERLDDRFKLLTGGSRTALPRQQTLRALVDWSYQTLNETEQHILRRLAVFSGGWTFGAAESVVGQTEAVEGLSGLVNKSLVSVEGTDGGSRYRFLETIRQYAMEKLVESGEATEARDRHLDYMMKIAEASDTKMFGEESLEWLDRMEVEHDNLRAALEWGTSSDPGRALKLVYAVGGFLTTRDYYIESARWCRSILEHSASLSNVEGDRAKVYALLGWSSITTGEHKSGRAAAEEGVALARQGNDQRTLVLLLAVLALSCTFLGDFSTALNATLEGETIARAKGYQGELAMLLSGHAQLTFFMKQDLTQALAYLNESSALGREAGFRWVSSMSAFGAARIAGMTGDLKLAREKFMESAQVSRSIGHKRIVYSSQSEFAHILRAHREYDEALELYRGLLPKWKDLGHRAAVAHELECTAFILRAKGHPRRAATLLGAAEALREASDSVMTTMEQAEYSVELTTLRAEMTTLEFDEAWKAGRQLNMDEAIALASKEQAGK